MSELKWIAGGVTAPKGFKAAGVRCGIKQSGEDVAIICSELPCSSAGVFTTNQVKAAPVILSMQRARVGHAKAIVANSGNANSCTGEKGIKNAAKMAAAAAAELGITEHEVLVASTGIIGKQLPTEKLFHGIAEAADALSNNGGDAAARAIMTTDTVPKMAAVEFEFSGKTARLGGIAKGSGMICPNVATFFCFLTTDVSISPGLLQEAIAEAADNSFNCLTVDGDGSSNDTVLILANGAASFDVNKKDGSYDVFLSALSAVCIELAKQIARDGEGATKLVEVCVQNAADVAAARTVAKSIANSPLVKTAIFGEDLNWGRVLVAAGKCGVEFDPAKVSLRFGELTVFDKGMPTELPPDSVNPLKRKEVTIHFDMNAGSASAKVWTCDFTYDYIKINAEYHT